MPTKAFSAIVARLNELAYMALQLAPEAAQCAILHEMSLIARLAARAMPMRAFLPLMPTIGVMAGRVSDFMANQPAN